MVLEECDGIAARMTKVEKAWKRESPGSRMDSTLLALDSRSFVCLVFFFSQTQTTKDYYYWLSGIRTEKVWLVFGPDVEKCAF